MPTKIIHFLYFLLILGISILLAMWAEFFLVGIIVFAILIKPIMNERQIN